MAVLSFLLIFPFLLCGNFGFVLDYAREVEYMEVYKDGNEIVLNEKKQDMIEQMMQEILAEAHSMPAFGVSLHEETLKEMQKGFWIKYKFEKTQNEDSLPFDEIVFKVEKDFGGQNFIRGNDGIYEGRCYYLSFNKNMDELFDLLSTFSDETIDKNV